VFASVAVVADAQVLVEQRELQGEHLRLQTEETREAMRLEALEPQRLVARTAAFKEQTAALHPELVATLKSLGHQQFAASLTRNLSPLAILGGESVSDVAQRLLAGPPGVRQEE